MSKKVAVTTLGCKVNYYESESLKELLAREGYRAVDFNEKADLYLVNTCTVTHLSDRKSRQLIRRARRRNPDAVICVTGCYAQVNPEEVAKIEGVDLIVGTHNRYELPRLVEEARWRRKTVNAVKPYSGEEAFEDLPVTEQGRTRAFLKIQEGCRQFCTYCIIPYARGPLRSRPSASVLRAVEQAAVSGFKEVVLTGIHLGLYGTDSEEEMLLPELLDSIDRLLERINGVERLRLSSLEPFDLKRELVEAVANLSRICSHLHLPLQSGDDGILQKMGRPYTAGEYKKLVDGLRRQVPDLALTTDIMVGFPGETAEQFEHTRKFAAEMEFSRIHVFKFSPRQGTPAAEMAGQIPPTIKDERSKKLSATAEELARRYRQKFVGRVMPVLAEVPLDGGWLEGLTEHYLRVRFPAPENFLGQIHKVIITGDGGGYLLGQREG